VLASHEKKLGFKRKRLMRPCLKNKLGVVPIIPDTLDADRRITV
jgi:hypothetical protein